MNVPLDTRRGLCSAGVFALTTVAAAGALAAPAAPIAVRHLVPGRHAEDICIDTPLYLTFNRPPVVGNAGTIRVYRSDGTPVDSIDLADPESAKRPIGGATAGGNPYLFNYYPVIVTGRTAAIYLHRSLDYGRTYYVLVDDGVFEDADGLPFHGIRSARTWRFTTRASGPPAGATRLVVDGDGDGDFCTVQGAIDFVPTNNTQGVVIDVRRGTYTEIVYVSSRKPFITVRGADRTRTVVQYANNNNFNGQVSGLFRAMFGVDAADFVLENISLHNTTPYRGSQAEAFRGYGMRTLLNRVNLSSFQDTLLLQNSGFVTNSYIEGDVDFMWGGGPVFFQNCELRALHAGYYTQIRNPLGTHGNVYVNSRLTRDPDLVDDTVYLGRIDPTVFPYSEAVYINSAMDAHVRPAGWLLNNADCGQARTINYAEYHSTDLNGQPLDVNERLACSNQLTDEQAAQFGDPAFVLAGWVPNTVNAAPDVLAPGDPITVNWSAPPGHSDTDWIGLYRRGAPDGDYVSVANTATRATTGTLTFTAPADDGPYEFRYFLADGFTKAAISNTVLVR
jgi:pectin methylesterase-like acyl-CoA thioesterase